MVWVFKTKKKTTETSKKVCRVYSEDAITNYNVANCFWFGFFV